MSILLPNSFSLGDMVGLALKASGWVGIGQTPDAEDLQIGWAQIQMMLQAWARQRWLIPKLDDLSVVSTGAQSYTIGPGGAFNIGAQGSRPNRLEAAYLRQITQGAQDDVDYPMGVIESMEDYSKIRLKTLQSFPQYAFLQPNWPAGLVYFWPVPQPSIYELHVIVRSQLPTQFASQATLFSIPYEYYECILFNLTIRIMQAKQIPVKPGNTLPMLAKNSMSILRQGNTAISRLSMPSDLSRATQYNIFSDQTY